MNNKEYLDFINTCEKKYKVKDWKMGGMHLWPIVRCYLFRELVKSTAPTGNGLKRRIMHTINSIRDWRNCVWFPSKCDVLFLGNGATKSFFEGSWYDYLIQPIMETHKKAGDKCLFLERGIFYRYPRSCRSLLTRIFEEIAVVLAHFIPKGKCPDELTKLFEELGKPYVKPMLAYALGVKFISYFYFAILAIARPKKVYIVCYYTMNGMAMCYACAKMGIPTIELQHGNTHNNFAYQGWQQVPKEYYNTIPQIFWFWTEEDKCEFLSSNSNAMTKKAMVYVSGIPWMNFWKSDDKRVIKYQSMLEKRSKKYKLNILVTLRPNIFGGNEWDGLVSLIKDSKDDVFWWVRKHPTALAADASLQAISSIEQDNVDYELASTLPLFSLLRFVDLHITTASNVAIEAKLFEVDTIFISNLAKLEMPQLLNKDSIIIITDLKKLKLLIKQRLRMD